MGNQYPVCEHCGTRHRQCTPSQVVEAGLDYIETTSKPRRVQHLRIFPRLDGLNELIAANRTHWSKGRALKEANEALVHLAITRDKLQPITGRFNMKILWLEKDSARDPDNILSAKKYILDALQQAHIIVNDNQKNLTGLTEQWDVAKKEEKPGVYIEITEE